MNNKLIDIDYFLANEEKINKIKNKRLLNAISALLKFQSNNGGLIFDRNTEKITTATQYTVFMYNRALLEDISSSYDLLSESINEVLESDFKELLEDNPIIYGKEAEYYKSTGRGTYIFAEITANQNQFQHLYKIKDFKLPN